GSQLTFQQSSAAQVASLENVAQVTSGLTLLAEHQEGVVPKIVAKLKTGGQTFQIQRNIPRPTAAPRRPYGASAAAAQTGARSRSACLRASAAFAPSSRRRSRRCARCSTR